MNQKYRKKVSKSLAISSKVDRFDDNGNMVIAKMTPREMFRFMDVDAEYVDKIEKVCGSSGLLKMAGNSIVVSVLYHIFKQMFVK